MSPNPDEQLDLVERVARAIFACSFHPSESAELIAQKWNEWPSDKARAFNQARAAIAAHVPDERRMIRCGEPEFDVDVPALIGRLNAAIVSNEPLPSHDTRCDMKLASMVLEHISALSVGSGGEE